MATTMNQTVLPAPFPSDVDLPPVANFVVDRFVNSSNPNVTHICGFLPFCQHTAVFTCSNTKLSECPECNTTTAGVFVFCVLFLGLVILLANGFVIFCTIMKRPGFIGHYSVIKASLAGSDVLTGIQLLVVAVYNFSWSFNVTASQLDEQQLAMRGSVGAVFGGMLYLIGFSASLNHLILMGQQRLYAILQPIYYKRQSGRTVYLGIAIAWSLAILSATVPLWFPGVYIFTYSTPIFLYNVSLQAATVKLIDPIPLIVLFGVLYIVPFVIMTTISIITVVVVKQKVVSKWRELRQSDQQKEIAIFTTLAVMQIGFTVTLLPILVVVSLTYSVHFNCYNLSVPYSICFYLSTSNSFVNVLTYSARDSDFRKAIVHYFPLCCHKKKMKVTNNSKMTSHNHLGLESAENHHASTTT